MFFPKKLNIAPENWPKPKKARKERIVFLPGPSFFRVFGKLATFFNFGNLGFFRLPKIDTVTLLFGCFRLTSKPNATANLAVLVLLWAYDLQSRPGEIFGDGMPSPPNKKKTWKFVEFPPKKRVLP